MYNLSKHLCLSTVSLLIQKLQASVEQRTDDEQEAVKRNKTLVNKNRNGADIPGKAAGI
jgi:hypothetical protein